jgi:hypothetical protein
MMFMANCCEQKMKYEYYPYRQWFQLKKSVGIVG